MTYVGQGLTNKSFDEAVAQGLNPNPNPPGRFHSNLGDINRMKAWIVLDQASLIQTLKSKNP